MYFYLFATLILYVLYVLVCIKVQTNNYLAHFGKSTYQISTVFGLAHVSVFGLAHVHCAKTGDITLAHFSASKKHTCFLYCKINSIHTII